MNLNRVDLTQHSNRRVPRIQTKHSLRFYIAEQVMPKRRTTGLTNPIAQKLRETVNS